jgi:cystathionine beta-lyase
MGDYAALFSPPRYRAVPLKGVSVSLLEEIAPEDRLRMWRYQRYAGRDIMPMWVADMDFKPPQAVRDALVRHVRQGALGYTRPWLSLNEAVMRHCDEQYAWSIDPDWIVWLPGLVCGLHLSCQITGQPGSAVYCATPIYPPFLRVADQAGRYLFHSPLRYSAERWQWDWPSVDTILSAQHVRLFMLCHPHNPVGRQWNTEELNDLLDRAQRHNFVVCSDEIHADLCLDRRRRHRPFASLGKAAADRSITLMSASKTYNLPGLSCAWALIPNPELRSAFRRAMRDTLPEISVAGLIATEAALTHGEPWRQDLIAVLSRNAQRLSQWAAAHPGLSMASIEATYLGWMNAQNLGVHSAQQYFEDRGVGLSDGVDFGAPGFVRINLGCTPERLESALKLMSS